MEKKVEHNLFWGFVSTKDPYTIEKVDSVANFVINEIHIGVSLICIV